jgi:hypothetical protein
MPTWRVALVFAALALPVAVLRYFLAGWLAPLGVPAWIGSLLASLWVLLGVALVVLFGRQGRARDGRWLRAALPFVALAAWCELLVIGGILASDARGAQTYYCGPFEAVRATFPTAPEHAVGHLGGFVPRAAIWLVLGAIVFAIARRAHCRRRAT